MAILSLFAIALLSSTHALDLSSSSEVVKHFQGPHSSLKAEVLASTQKIFAPLKSIPQDIQQSRASYVASPLQPHLMQDQAACAAATNASCVAGFVDVALVILAADASEAEGIAEQFCTACTDPATEYDAYITACGLTGDDATTANLQRALVEAACVNSTCAANAVWGSGDPIVRRDAFCPNLECGLEVLTAGQNFSTSGMLNVTEFACDIDLFELTCLTDEADSSIYCMDFMTPGQVNASINATALCATTCPRYMTLLMREYEQCVGMGDDDSDTMTDEDEDCDFVPFTLNDLCIQNENNVFCQDFFNDLMQTMGPNVTECGFDVVPAPGVEPEAPTNCSSVCEAQLQAFVNTGGCCTGLFIEMDCPDPDLLTFINTTCGVAYEVCERPDFPTRSPATPTSTDANSDDPALTDGGRAALGVSAAVTSILVIAALAALL